MPDGCCLGVVRRDVVDSSRIEQHEVGRRLSGSRRVGEAELRGRHLIAVDRLLDSTDCHARSGQHLGKVPYNRVRLPARRDAVGAIIVVGAPSPCARHCRPSGKDPTAP
jgi:hypothetical protein